MNTHKFFVTLLFLTGISVVLSAQDFPAVSNRLVNDYTQTLNTAEIDQLERKLVAFDDSTSIQIAVVIMKSTGRYNIADYGVRLAQKWGIGSKENDTGILLLVALGDRAVTIQTGYGVEGAVPDAIAYRIIENEIKPAFRQGNYYLGLQRATDALIAHTKGEYKADPKRRSEGGSAGSLVLLVLIIIVIIVLIAGRNNDGNSGEIMGRGGASDALWWSILLGGMGRGGRGGFGGGGLGRGGGFGGGGFGGFGGGGFGGGGASGRW